MARNKACWAFPGIGITFLVRACGGKSDPASSSSPSCCRPCEPGSISSMLRKKFAHHDQINQQAFRTNCVLPDHSACLRAKSAGLRAHTQSGRILLAVRSWRCKRSPCQGWHAKCGAQSTQNGSPRLQCARTVGTPPTHQARPGLSFQHSTSVL